MNYQQLELFNIGRYDTKPPVYIIYDAATELCWSQRGGQSRWVVDWDNATRFRSSKRAYAEKKRLSNRHPSRYLILELKGNKNDDY